MGHEVRSLQPCGEEQFYWLKLSRDLRRQLQQAVDDLTSQPYEVVYAELDGEFAARPESGFGADYAGAIVVEGIGVVSKQGIGPCRSGRLKPDPEAVAVADTRTYAFVCDTGLAFTARTSPTGAWVFLPGETRKLLPIPAVTGSRYRDADFEINIHRQAAQLASPAGGVELCRNDPRRAVWERAKLDGAAFRAVGNEPGWSLEIIAGDRIVLTTDYGASRVEVPFTEPYVDQINRRTRWDLGELIVDVMGRPCRDSMSGELFDTEVSVQWQGRTLRGCGRALH
ncbi:MAG: hypothetical protein WBM67_10920, partial [Sedimenticolaceae bacterium]